MRRFIGWLWMTVGIAALAALGYSIEVHALHAWLTLGGGFVAGLIAHKGANILDSVSKKAK